MNHKEAIDYVNRRHILSQRQEYLNKMIDALNDDVSFKTTNIRFSKSNNNFHFVERFSDRDLDIEEILPKFYQFILKHRCQIIYYCYLKDKPKRLELEIGNIRLGLAHHSNSLSFRTIFEKFENRHPGSIENFIINDTQKYYESI